MKNKKDVSRNFQFDCWDPTLEKGNIKSQVDRLRSELRGERKCSQKADSRPKRSASLFEFGSKIIENGQNLGLKCYPCQKSSLFITKEVSKDPKF